MPPEQLSRRSRRRPASLARIAARTAVAVTVGAALLSPAPGSAQADDPEAEREEVRERRAEIELEIDALEARDAEISQALADLQANVATQEAELAEAERALEAAEEDLADAEEAVVAAEQRIAELEAATDELVVETFVNGPSTATGLEVFTAESISDAAVKQAIIGLQADSDADLLDRLDAAREDLEIERTNREQAAEEAEELRDASAAELADLQDALAQQQEFAADVEQRLDQRLAEAQSLEELDAELSQQIAEQQAELARQLQEAQAAAEASAAPAPAPAPAPTSQSSSIELATVTCPTGGTITVAASIAGNVQGLLDLAGQQGVGLCGGGYRDPQRQIELRMEHCGTSYYAIYEMPSSQCSPPTARPGQSNHEQGLAIDFTCNGAGAVREGDECWNFLVANAADYGLYNLPSESWHWSVDGT